MVKIKQLLRRVFRWLKSLFMQNKVKETYATLVQIRDQDFKNLEAYLNSEKHKGYTRFLSQEGSECTYQIGDKKFLLKAEIRELNNHMRYTTFLIDTDPNNYPHKRLTEIEGLTLFAWEKETRYFTEEKSYEEPASLGPPISGKSIKLGPADFSEGYIAQVCKWIRDLPIHPFIQSIMPK